MNSYMNVQVRVIGQAAQAQLKALRAHIAALNGATAAGTKTTSANTAATRANNAAQSAAVAAHNRATAAVIRHNASLHAGALAMNRWGNQVQWTGRQLQRNWTIPLALAAGAATKFALDNERAFVHTQKVYGDAAAAEEFWMKKSKGRLNAQQANAKAERIFAKELEALQASFRAASEHFGVHLDQVYEISGAWAAAGQSGAALAASVDTTMQAMKLGNMEAMEATKALIAIQAQYNLNSEELIQTLYDLNAVENQTGIELSGLITGFEKAAGVARAAGIDVRTLSAHLAALVPASGSASTAGNALKTIYSRLLATTGDTVDVLEEMGFQLDEQSWKSATVGDRLILLTKQFETMSDGQKAVAASIIGSRWQFNRLLILLDELNSESGYYQKALSATENQEKSAAQATKELNAILDSTPNKFDRIWVMIKNGMAEAITPLLTLFLSLFMGIRQLVDAFTSLNPATQKLLLYFGLFVAVLPLIITYVGSLMTFLGAFARVFTVLLPAIFTATSAIGKFAGALIATPVKWAIGAVAGIGGAFITAGSVVLKSLGLHAAFTAGATALHQGFWLWLIGLNLKFSQAWIAAKAATMTALKGVWAAGLGSMTISTATFSNTLSSIWASMHMRITAIQILSGFRLPVLWTAMTLKIGAIQTAFSKILLVMWGNMHKGLLSMTVAFRKGMIQIYWTLVYGILNVIPLLTAGIGKLMRLLPAIFLSPWGLAVAGVIAILYTFRDQIATIWNNIVSYFSDSSNGMVTAIIKSWNALPQGVANALTAVARVVQTIAMQIYEWFSYINPFARHSPSLVENVNAGMDAIEKRFAKAGNVGKYLKGAYADIKAFGQATAHILKGAASFEAAENRKKVKKFAPGALDEYDRLNARLLQLKPALAAVESRMKAQEAVVARWEDRLDSANEALDRQQAKLQRLSDRADKWREKLEAANDALQGFASAPIVGMQAASNAIFENEMAQKRLRLEMMKMEDAGHTFEDVKDKIDALSAAQELLRGEQASLRAAGAGSEITGAYDAEIAALEAQKKAMENSTGPINEMQAQLEALERQAEMMDLENALKFDPLTRQIDQAANAVEELSFEEIMAGIRASQADIAKYTGKWEEASAAVERQQQVVDAATAKRDAIQKSLDAERKKLDRIKQTYDALNDAIRSVEQTMNDVVGAADKMTAALDKKKKGKSPAEEAISPALEAFRNAEGSNFPKVGGSGMPMREDWTSQVEDIEKFTQKYADDAAKLMSELNPFAPLKRKWNDFTGWLSARWSDLSAGMSDMFSNIFGGGATDTAQNKITEIWTVVKIVFGKIGGVLKSVWDLLGPELIETFQIVGKYLKKIWTDVAPELAKFKKLIEPLWTIFKKATLPILAVIGGAILGLIKIIWSMLNNALGPVLSGAISIIKGFYKTFRGIFELILGVLTGDWKLAWDGVKSMLSGTLDIIWGLIKTVFGGILGLVTGFVEGVVNFFKWLYDVLVGNSIVPDLIDGIWSYFKTLAKLAKWVWDSVLKPIYDFFVSLWKNYVAPALKAWWAGIKSVWSALKAAAGWVWDNILKPIFKKVEELWSKRVKPALNQWWQNIKNTWNVLKGLGRWVWDNVLKPVLDWFKDLWTRAKAELVKWKDRITAAWSNLKTLGSWIKTNVADPIFEKITGVWGRIRDWFSNNKNILANGVKGVVNVVIRAVNSLITGLNKVSRNLPGISFSIKTIPVLEMADGGPIPRNAAKGFKTNGARAIVGEGKANYPEYVIPTDPTYRNRARSLMADAAARMGLVSSGIRNRTGGEMGDLMNVAAGGQSRDNWLGTPLFEKGGILGRIKDAVGGAARKTSDWIVNGGKAMATFLAKPFLAKARNLVDGVGWSLVRGIGNYGIDKVESWLKAADDVYETEANAATGGPKVQAALKFARSQAGKPYGWGAVGPDAYDCSGFMSALTNVLRGQKPYMRVGATGSFPWAGFAPGTGPAKGFAIGSSPNYAGSGIGHMAGTLGGINVESAGGVGVRVGAGARGVMDSGFSQRYHLPLKEGAIALARRGPVPAIVGDGRYDEAVVPLPYGWKSGGILGGGEEKTVNVHIHGNLSFPNITDGNDAEQFIRNIENLAKD